MKDDPLQERTCEFNGRVVEEMKSIANYLKGHGSADAARENVDHERRARSTDHRLDSAWFGQGASLKQEALEQALLMVA